jgi:hypothetical protein
MKSVFQLSGSLVVAGIAVALAASPVNGQPGTPNPFYSGAPAQAPAGTNQPPAQTQGMARLAAAPTTPPTPVQNTTYYNNVVAPVGGYYPYNDPYGGYLSGKANLVNASGQFMIANQQAALMQQQVTQSQVDTRNKIIQQRMYENSITPNTEDVRMQEMLTKLRHSRNSPPPADIWSGDALNSLYQAILSAQRTGIQAYPVALDAETLKHINLTQPGKVNASIGILRDGGKLDWPLVLQDDAFKKDREKLDELSPRAVAQAATGKVDAKTQNELAVTVDRMQATLLRMVADVAPDQYMAGKKFLRELGKSYKVLQDPNVANFFGKWVPRGRTVAELVQHLTTNGLEFAPASPGDEPAYQALYQNFLTYDSQIGQLVARQAPSQ